MRMNNEKKISAQKPEKENFDLIMKMMVGLLAPLYHFFFIKKTKVLNLQTIRTNISYIKEL